MHKKADSTHSVPCADVGSSVPDTLRRVLLRPPLWCLFSPAPPSLRLTPLRRWSSLVLHTVPLLPDGPSPGLQAPLLQISKLEPPGTYLFTAPVVSH